jgi:hypothetical protein
VTSEHDQHVALLERMQAPCEVFWWLSLVACVGMWWLGSAATPLIVGYVVFGVATTLAVSTYFRSDILKRRGGTGLFGWTLGMSSPIFLDQAMGGVLVKFSMPVLVFCFCVALASIGCLAMGSNRS